MSFHEIQRLMDNLIRKLVIAANRVIRVVGSMIFLVLVFFALIHTQYMIPGGAEKPVNGQDSILSNILVLGVAVLVMYVLLKAEKKIPQNVQKIIARCMVMLTMLWTAGVGFWWITVVDRVPEGDQAYIYGGASYFLEGQYFFLDKGGYLDMYPHQLGLIFLVELLFLVVGTYNYFAFQVLCVLATVGIVWCGYALVRRITKSFMMTVGYCMLTACCLPLFFYTGWVYGDIPGTFFILLAANMLASYEEKGGWGYLAGVVISFLLAVMVRQNSLIFLVAFCLAAVVHVLHRKDKKLLVAMVLAVLCPILVSAGINKMYELRSGFAHSDGMSTYSFIAMGLQEQGGVCGWDSAYCKDVYYGVGCDTELAKQINKADMWNRIRELCGDPVYAAGFFGKKVLTQWNAPLYQCLYFSNKYQEGTEPEPDSFVAKISNEYYEGVLDFADGIQFIVYAGILCYFLFAVKKDSTTLSHMIAVGIIGGFFFSIIWEAKARYILPYYLVMYPLAVIGYRSFFGWLKSCQKNNER